MTYRALLIIFSFLLCSLAAYIKGNHDGSLKVLRQWDQSRITQAELATADLNRVIDRERELQRHADQLTKEKQDEINKLIHQRNAALDSLRDRKERAPTARKTDQVAINGGGTEGLTGRQLFREDAAFLVGEAARADYFRIELGGCLKEYEFTAEKMNGE